MFKRTAVKKLFCVLVFLTAVASYAMGKSEPVAPGVSDARYAKLAKGVNLYNWFCYPRGNYDTFVTSDDIKLLKGLGMNHIRLVIMPSFLYNSAEPSVIKPENLARIDKAIDMLLANDMAIIVDMHGLSAQELNDNYLKFAEFWGVLAKHLSVRDPEMVFLEVLNEPDATVGMMWCDYQEQIIKEMRKGAPEHTIIATVHDWSSIDNLVVMSPLKDRNIVYNFHYYQPFEFTHQGATWGEPVWKYYSNVPYPSSPEAVAKCLPYVQNKDAREMLGIYGEDRWDAAKIEARIALAAKWAEKKKVRVICNEFGVSKQRPLPEFRYNWLRDVTKACEKYNIGWNMWEYSGGFGLTDIINGQRKLDVGTAKALGLNTENVDPKFLSAPGDEGYIYNDGFEPKIMNIWTRDTKEKGCTLSGEETTIKKTGMYAMKAADEVTGGNIAEWSMGLFRDTFYFRFYTYIPQSFLDDMKAKGGNRVIARTDYADGISDIRIQVNAAGKLACVVTGKPAAESVSAIQPDKWICVEYQPPLQTGSGDVSVNWWIDGQAQPVVTFPSGPLAYYTNFHLGLGDSYGTDYTQQVIYYDELSLNKNYVGPLKETPSKK